MKKIKGGAKAAPSVTSKANGVVGARGGGYGPKTSRSSVNTGGRRGSKLRGGQTSFKSNKIYKLGP